MSAPAARRGAALRQERRDQVLSAAMRCFEAEGFHRTSMADVVAASGMSAGSVYRYYASKSDLIRACIDAVTAGADAALRPPDDGDGAPLPPPAQALAQVLEQTLAVGDRYGVDVGRIALNAWAEALRDPALRAETRGQYTKVRDLLTRSVAAWRDAGHLPPGTDAEAVGRVLFSALPGYVVQQQLLGDVPLSQYAAGLAAMLGGEGAVPVADGVDDDGG